MNRINLNILKTYFTRAKQPILKPVLTVIQEDEKQPGSLLIKAHFLGQLAHESGSFATLEEYASGKAYENRKDLGNIFPGDGVKYKGRGYIQLTGRANYSAASKALGLDLVEDPDQLLTPDIAMTVSQWFWNSHDLNALALKEDIVTITKIINGGTRGLSHRIHMVNILKKILGVQTSDQRPNQ